MLNKLIERSTSILLILTCQYATTSVQALSLRQLESVIDLAANSDTTVPTTSDTNGGGESVETVAVEAAENPFSFTVEELLQEGEKATLVEDEEANSSYYYDPEMRMGYAEPDYNCYGCDYCHTEEAYPCPSCDIVECPNLCDIKICDDGSGSGSISSSHTDTINIFAGSTDTLPGSTANEVVACNECGVAVGSNKQCGTGYVEKAFYIDGCIKVHETTDTHECTGQRTCNDGRFYKRTESCLSAEGGDDPGVECPCCDLCPEPAGDATCTTCSSSSDATTTSSSTVIE